MVISSLSINLYHQACCGVGMWGWSKKSLRPSAWRLRRRGNASNVSKNLPSVLSRNQMFLLVIIIMIIHLSRNKIGHDCLLQPVFPRQTGKREKKSRRFYSWLNE